MTWNVFVRYFQDNERHMPRAFADNVRRTATARYRERILSGRADGPLVFNDLIARCERVIAGDAA